MDLFDYLKLRGKRSFEKEPFNEVDALCLCQFSYLPLEGIVQTDFDKAKPMQEICKEYLEEAQTRQACFGRIMGPKHIRLVESFQNARRFSKARLCGYMELLDHQAQMQFCAMTVLIGDEAFLSFRGTDGTIVGWKEDFNMGYLHSVPSQIAATQYLESVAAAFPGSALRVGGHSKGGNLAVFACAFCSDAVKEKIRRVYSYDGPGFHEEVLQSSGFKSIEARIDSFVPQTSIVGMLLSHEENYRVVHSTQHGFMQHDAYSWSVEGNSFVYLGDLNRTSRYIDRTLKEWISTMDIQKQEAFSDAVYGILSESKAKTVQELSRQWLKNAALFRKQFQNSDEETKKMIKETLDLLFQSARKALEEPIKEKLKPPKIPAFQRSKKEN